jgi:EAL and modified HD-GYP domain-containing signal transduction protein
VTVSSPATAVTAPNPEAADVAVVRRPVSDARRGVVGYELVVGGDGRRPHDTAALLLDAFGDIGIEQLSGIHPAWIAVSPEFLAEVGTPPLRPDRAVLQLPAAPADDALLGVLQQLTRTGYTLAVDHYVNPAGLGELLSLCSIVKISVGGRSDAELRAIMTAPTAYGALLTATGVESHEDFERCQALGFTYFQGSFFAKPRTVRHRGVATAGVGSLRALSELGAGDVSFEDLERIISSDVGLSLKLLRYVNSAFFALPRNVGSVREALQMLGVRTVKRWATVMAMSSIPDVPSELIGLALHRARMCETLGDDGTPATREAYFTVGLFSVADALLGQPMEDVLEELPFDDAIRAALLRHEGPMGELLAALVAYERGEFPELPSGLAADGRSIAGAYREALEWADSARRVAG